MTNQELNRYMTEVVNGNTQALSIIYNEFSGAVYGLALSILRDKERAQDNMQDTFISVMTNAREYRDDLNGKAWLFRIARNLAISKYRKIRNEALVDTTDSLFDIPSEEQYLDERVVNSVVLRNALNHLCSIESQIVILHTVAGLKHKEIAKILDLSIGTVCSKYFYSLKKLKKYIELQEGV